MQNNKQSHFMGRSLSVAALTLSASITAMAADANSAFFTEADVYSDSDDLKVDQWSLGYKQSDGIFSYAHKEKEPEGKLLWGLKATRSNIDQSEKSDYRGRRIAATLGQKFNKKLSAELGVGRSELENNTTRKDESLTNYHLNAKAKITDQLAIHATHDRDYLFTNAIVEGDAGSIVHGDTSNIGIHYRPFDKWRLEGKAKHVKISDGNSSDQLSGAVLYGISSGWPWIWAGVTAEKLEYDKMKDSYWTPADYQTVGLTVDSNFPVTDNLDMSLAASVNRSKEDDHDSGTGYSISAGTNWNIAESISLKASGYLLESKQATSDWKQDGINVSINMKSY